MSEPSHLFAGRQGRPGHRNLLCPAPSVIETKRNKISFRGVVILLSAIGVVMFALRIYFDLFA